MNIELLKYLSSVLIYGSNGIVANYIDLASYEVVFMRGVISVIFLLSVFKLTGGTFTFLQHRKDFLYLMTSGLSMGISAMFLFEGYLYRYGLGDWAKGRYATLPVKASACIGCGACEDRCPYHLPIRQMLKTAAEKFGE